LSSFFQFHFYSLTRCSKFAGTKYLDFPFDRCYNNLMLNRKSRVERIKKNVNLFDYSACALSFNDDKNVNFVYRSLSNFGGKEFFVVGSPTWAKGATNGLQDFIKVHHFQDFSSFFKFIREETDYTPIAIEQSERAENIYSFEYPRKPLFIFGNESYGLNDEVLLNCSKVVEIPLYGNHPCANVGVCSGIVFYDFTKKLVSF